MDSQDNRGPIAQARRLYLHRQAGGSIKARDMGLIVEDMEKMDEERTKLRAALEKAVKLYGKPGGPWNVPSEPGAWLRMAKDTLGGE